MKINKWLILLIIVISTLLITKMCLLADLKFYHERISSNSDALTQQILDKCEEKGEIDFNELIKQEWDRAYCIRGSNSIEFERLTGIKNRLESLDSEFYWRIVFTKDNTIVYDFQTNSMCFIFFKGSEKYAFNSDNSTFTAIKIGNNKYSIQPIGEYQVIE